MDLQAKKLKIGVSQGSLLEKCLFLKYLIPLEVFDPEGRSNLVRALLRSK